MVPFRFVGAACVAICALGFSSPGVKERIIVHYNEEVCALKNSDLWTLKWLGNPKNCVPKPLKLVCHDTDEILKEQRKRPIDFWPQAKTLRRAYD